MNVPETATAGKCLINVSIQEIYKDRKETVYHSLSEIETACGSGSQFHTELKRLYPATSHYLPDCSCGGTAKHWLQIINAANIWHWVECLDCGKYTELSRSRESAEQDWRDIVAGVIREKRVHWDIGF